MRDDIDAALGALVPRWLGYWPGADPVALADDVRRRLAAAVAAWGLCDVQPLPGGNVALVAAAVAREGGVVVKVHARGHGDEAELRAEGVALEHWAPTGAAVVLLGRRDDGLTLLLERVRPGDTLAASGAPDEEVLAVLGALAARLHRAGPAPTGVPQVVSLGARWLARLESDRAGAAEAALVADLCAPRGDDVLVHADLHSGNALSCDDAPPSGTGWTAVDPHGLRADRHADVWALLAPQAPALPDDAAAAGGAALARVRCYAAAADLDAGRAASWVRLRARVVALQLPPRDAWGLRLHALADALGPGRAAAPVTG